MNKKILEIDVADEVRHLSSNEIEELYKRYLEGEKNSVLINDYKIDINPNKLINVLPPIKFDDTLCPYCDIPMFAKRRSKSASNWGFPPTECFSCSHKILSEQFGYRYQQCECEKCVDIRRQRELEAEKKKREAIRKLYNLDDREPVYYSELNFFHKLVLLTLFRMQTDEEFGHILSLDDPYRSQSLSPTHQMDIECLNELFSCGALILDPESRIEAFVEDEEFKSFYINRVRWIPNITFDGGGRAELSAVYNKIYNELRKGTQPQWEKEIFDTLFRIAREEVMQYVYVNSGELNVNFSAEKKTREVINQLLQNFSASEIYYFVKRSVENAHIYYSKGHAKNKKHAANTIPNKILSLGERALDEEWDTYRYSCDSRAPRSYISHVFFDFFLQDEDAGFHKSPGKYWEKELHPRYLYESEADSESELFCHQCCSEKLTLQMVNDVLEINCNDCGSSKQFTPSKR